MEQLPQELILHIASFLKSRDILALNLVSRQFLEISRDNELWRKLCFQNAFTPSRSFRHREERYGGPVPIQESNIFALQRPVPQTTRSPSQNNDDNAESSSKLLAETTSSIVDCDFTHPGEEVDWYHEYIARHAPLSMSWLSAAPLPSSGLLGFEVRGMSLLKKDGNDILVTPMGDGSVCLWDIAYDVGRPTHRAGQIMSRSDSEILSSCDRKEPTSVDTHKTNVVECVSVDQSSGKAYFAVDATLTEVDLNTMKVSGQKIFTHPICSLSEGGVHPDPLTVGTTRSIHIYDPRDSSLRTSAHTGRAYSDGLASATSPQDKIISDFQRIQVSDGPFVRQTNYARIEPLPLSIAHLSNDIYVGGRFPSILSYDRRFVPLRMTSIYSGARNSALAIAKSQNSTKDTIVAAGEYKGKGSLELYPLSKISASNPFSSTVPLKNRTSASRSKLLSVIPHGTRLLFSDLDGQLKWVERDGSTLVRRWNINNWSVYNSDEARGNIFNAGADDGDVARKLLALDEGERSEVLIWTGEKVGVMGYGTTGKSAKEAKTDGERTSEDEEASSENEERYGRMMRRALERQADEVRFVRGLGLGR